MTEEEFGKVVPRQTTVRANVNGENKELLVKFFLCNSDDNFDGYWMCCTEDMDNPCPSERLNSDYDIFPNNAEIIKYRNNDNN